MLSALQNRAEIAARYENVRAKLPSSNIFTSIRSIFIFNKLKAVALLTLLAFLILPKGYAQQHSDELKQFVKSSNEDFDSFVKKSNKDFDDFVKKSNDEFNRYVDSINREFARFLGQPWREFTLQTPEPPIKKPVATPPVFNPRRPQPKPHEVPVSKKVEPPLPKPQPKPLPKPKPVVDTSQPVITANFFGTAITAPRIQQALPHLKSVAERDVAAYWSALRRLPCAALQSRLMQAKNELLLNDWALYLLIGQIFDRSYPQATPNEKVVFTVLMLNQLGYRAKIGRAQGELVPLVAFQSTVYNTGGFTYGDEANVRYSVVNPTQRELPSLQACAVDYPNAGKMFDVSLPAVPRFTQDVRAKTLSDKANAYTLQYNKNLVSFYGTYPCVDFRIFAEAAWDEAFARSVAAQIAPRLQGRSQEEAVNILLHFVQYAFAYKTDPEQFGYEKWFFAEETITAPYSDCDDRAILFAQLVRRLLRLPVVLVHYPSVHLATAVQFDNPQAAGSYLMVDGQKFILCDPTYIGATLGMAMPNLSSMRVEVITLK